MKTKLFYLLSFFMISMGMKAQNIYIPDANFKAKLLSSSANNTVAKDLNGNYFAIDANGDGQIQQSEANQVGALDLNNSNINLLLGIENFINIETLDCSHNNLFNLDLNNLTNLKWMDGSYNTPLNASNGTITIPYNIEYINLRDTKFYELDVSNRSKLSYLNLENSTFITNLVANNCKLSTLILNGCTNLKSLNCRNNELTSLNLENLNIIGQNGVTWANVIGGVDCSHNNITNLNLTNLNTNFLDCSHNNLSTIDLQTLSLVGITGNTTFKPYLNVSNNQLTILDIKENLILQSLDCSYNNLTTLEIKKINTLDLVCSYNNLTSLIIDNQSHINRLDFSYNQMTSFVCHSLPKVDLAVLDYNQAQYSSILQCNNNNLNNLDISGLDLDILNCSFNNLTTLNLNDVKVMTFDASNNNLEYLFIKNGYSNIEYGIGENPNLKYICLDEDNVNDPNAYYTERGYAEGMISLLNLNNVSFNTYCNFSPGGNYNTITGTVRFDENNNGCDINDEVFEFLKLKINDGTNSGETFVKNDGKYDFFTQAGDFTVTAEPENPSLYTVTPSTFTTNFADSNNNISTQNICVTKNENVKDLEVVFAPVTDARPGFDAVYKVIWRNKGNTTLSGSVIVNFNNSKMSFLSSVLPSSVSGNQVTFNFTNLKPYANTASEITFNINPHTHATNPVNIGDILNFSANVTPLSGDANQDDNQFTYNQTVVGSYDPNDITCLEGNTIPLSMVGKYLHYMVNFENTGTAPASNIVVEMEINPDDFDISSLQLQNTSHQSYTKINGNKVEFMMKDINLAAAAHGNIALKIKSKNNLASGDSVSNKANIYFDYNFPVETNDAVTNIDGATLSSKDITKDKTSVNVYPNPTKGDLNITADSKINSIEIYDAQGRIVQKQIGINSLHTKLSIHSAISGVYIFKIITEKEIIMKKIIKN